MVSLGEENPDPFKTGLFGQGISQESEGRGYSSSQHGGHLGKRPA